jgi:hypothetical protein
MSRYEEQNDPKNDFDFDPPEIQPNPYPKLPGFVAADFVEPPVYEVDSFQFRPFGQEDDAENSIPKIDLSEMLGGNDNLISGSAGGPRWEVTRIENESAGHSDEHRQDAMDAPIMAAPVECFEFDLG